jgi:dolichol-phosphate mannosyltransferase
MPEPKKAVVIVPTYNEVDNIAALLDAIESQVPGLSVLVVDDNSPDGTQAVVEAQMEKRAHIHLLRRPGKQGLGNAYKAGFQWALDQGFEYLIEMDADFSHPPTALPTMLAGLQKSPVVVGSRYVPQGEVSGWGFIRQVISRCGNLYARAVLQVRTHDMTGGFNGWRRNVLEAIDYSTVGSKGYVFQIELKYRSLLKGYTISEFPIHFANRKLGKSKMSGSIFWEAALQVLKLRTASRQLLA